MLVTSTVCACGIAFAWHWWITTPEKLIPPAYSQVEELGNEVQSRIALCIFSYTSDDPMQVHSIATDAEFKQLLLDYAEAVDRLGSLCEWSAKVYSRRAKAQRARTSFASSLEILAEVNRKEAAYWKEFHTGLLSRISTYENASDSLAHIHAIHRAYESNKQNLQRLSSFEEDYEDHLDRVTKSTDSLIAWISGTSEFSSSPLRE